MNVFLLKNFCFSCILASLCLCVFASGCSTIKKIQHISQLLTLKRYSDSQEKITKTVGQQNKMFDELVKEIEEGGFAYKTAKQVFKRFGEPVFGRDVEYKGETREQWLYRHAKDFKGEKGKVYCYFDGEGLLIEYDYIKYE